MKIKPCGHWVLVDIPSVEETSDSGIVVRSAAEVDRENNGRDIGRVKSFGPIAYKSFKGCDGPEDWGVKIGDLVEFHGRYAGKESRFSEENESPERLKLIQDNDIIAVMEE